MFREVISKYAKIRKVPLTTKIKRKGYGKISCTGKTDLFSILDKISEPVHSVYPLTMEDIGQNYGYILYRTRLRNDETVNDIRLENASDRIQCYCNEELVYSAENENIEEKFEPVKKYTGGEMIFLCENVGRENFGTGLENQCKGISGSVKINDHRHFGFDIYPLSLDEKQIEKIDFDGEYSVGKSAFYKFDFEIDEPCDTFLDTKGFGKGCAFVNGFNIGRFWETGPQKLLYIPAPLLSVGTNAIILFETEGKFSDEIVLCENGDNRF